MLQINKIRPFIKQFIETFTFSRQTLTFLAIYRIYDHISSLSHICRHLATNLILQAKEGIIMLQFDIQHYFDYEPLIAPIFTSQ